LAYTSKIFYLPENILLNFFGIGGILPSLPPGYASGGNGILIAGYRAAQEFMIG